MKNLELKKVNTSKEELKEELVKLLEGLGYRSAVEEVKNNRNSLSNAKLVINGYCNDRLSDRINPVTMQVVYTPSEIERAKVEKFRDEMIELANNCLNDNNNNQQAYLDLKNNLINAEFNYAQKLSQFYAIEDFENVNIEKLEKEVKALEKILKHSENELDAFILNKLA